MTLSITTIIILAVVISALLYIVMPDEEEQEIKPIKKIKNPIPRADWKRYKHSLFCKTCYLHDYWFIGGGSWSPDACPVCAQTACVNFKNIPNHLKDYAIDKHREKWKAKFGCYPSKGEK